MSAMEVSADSVEGVCRAFLAPYHFYRGDKCAVSGVCSVYLPGWVFPWLG